MVYHDELLNVGHGELLKEQCARVTTAGISYPCETDSKLG